MYDEAAKTELESLYVRLRHQTTNAFFCISADAVLMQLQIAEDIRAREEAKEKAVICFEIAPDFRGKGVATTLLQRAITDAKAEGYIAVDGVK